MFVNGSYLVKKALSGFDKLQSNLQRGVELLRSEAAQHEASIAEQMEKHELYVSDKRREVQALDALRDDAERALRGIKRLLAGE